MLDNLIVGKVLRVSDNPGLNRFSESIYERY